VALVLISFRLLKRSYGICGADLGIGIGTWIASNLSLDDDPNRRFLYSCARSGSGFCGNNPLQIGAFVLFKLQFILYHSETDEYPPRIWMNLKREKAANSGVFQVFKRLLQNIAPCQSNEAISVVQFFSLLPSLTIVGFLGHPADYFANIFGGHRSKLS